MSGTDEPGYIQRRKERQQKAEAAEAAKRDAQKRDDHATAINALIGEVHGYRADQEKSDQKKLPIDKTAAVAVIIAAVLSFCSLVAFVGLTLKTDSTAQKALNNNEAAQRAFVTQSVFSGPQVFDMGDGKTMSRYMFLWENSGTTAAFHLRAVAQCGYSSQEMTDGRRSPFWQISEGTDPTYLAPKETATIGNCQIRNDLMADIAARKRFFYFTARADYIDAFGVSHTVKDCSELVLQPGGVADYVSCPHFSCTDKDCQ